MKGKLQKTDEQWVVVYEDITRLFPFTQYGTKEILLHPDDVNEIEEDSKRFDNIEARIAADPIVEFTIVKKFMASETLYYAKLDRKTETDITIPLSTIKELTQQYPNDQQLGEQIRKLFS
jgi:hypothetical protein